MISFSYLCDVGIDISQTKLFVSAVLEQKNA